MRNDINVRPFELHRGDCLDILKGLPDNSVDACVTDPPYGLSHHSQKDIAKCLTQWLAGEKYEHGKAGFMGRDWDRFCPGPEVWREVFRVLKPGGHVVAFAGSRTHDLMSMALRLAGFECRDTVMWVYGSGFPKSMDVSKAIDKANGKHERDLVPFGNYVREMREAKGWTLRQLDEAMGTNTAASWWEGRKAGVHPPGLEQYRKLKGILGMDGRFDELIEWLEAEREVIGRSENGIAGGSGKHAGNDGAYGFGAEYDITAPATDAARQWAGWGTALKPAFEPALLFRKPLIGTVAQNVLQHGTGALNIDGCRVPTDDDLNGGAYSGDARRRDEYSSADSAPGAVALSRLNRGVGEYVQPAGRWPANLIHDGSQEVVALFPDSAGSGGSVPNVKVTGYGDGIGSGKSEYLGGERTKVDAGSGSAARFFYCAKASRRDRNDGLPSSDEPAVGTGATMREREDADWGKRNGNHHPTVKPTDLMRYLARLVTPPGGLVLDPFTGSGSTGKACMLEGFRFVGCELSDEYADIAEARISHAWRQANPEPVAPEPVAPAQADLFAAV